MTKAHPPAKPGQPDLVETARIAAKQMRDGGQVLMITNGRVERVSAVTDPDTGEVVEAYDPREHADGAPQIASVPRLPHEDDS